jgi:pimeloyl-ACP methyl ester carboxylesterase
MSQDALNSTSLTTTSVDGTVIAYEKIGSGPAVVLVDGALCYRGFGPTRELAEKLSPGYTAYFYDRRGRGESGDTAPYSALKEIQDLAAVITAAGGDVYLFGQSSGAAISLEAAASGIRVKKLAVYEAPYLRLADASGHLDTLRKFLAEGRPGSAVGHFLVKMVGAPAFLPVMMRLMPKIWGQMKTTAPTLVYDTTMMNGFVAPVGRLSAIDAPTLVMGGSKGKENMKKAVQDVAAAVPRSQLKFLPGQTHQVTAKALIPELELFFRD